MVRHRRMRLLSRLCGGNGSVIKAATQPMLMQRRHAFRLCLCSDESDKQSGDVCRRGGDSRVFTPCQATRPLDIFLCG